MTLAEILQAAGYDTAAIGKMHFNSSLKHGFDRRIDQPNTEMALQAKRECCPPEMAAQTAVETLQRPGPYLAQQRLPAFGAVGADMAGTYFAQAKRRSLPGATSKAVFPDGQLYEPHSPFHFPVEYQGRHKPEEFKVPKAGPEDDWQVPEIFRHLTEREKQGIIAAYYTSAEFLDQNVGRVLEALAKSGQAENTLVIYTGDNGYMLGHHGRFEKHCGYGPSVRVPLLLRYPARLKPAQSTPALVEFIDLFPTVLDFVGLPLRGQRARPKPGSAADGKAKAHRTQVFHRVFRKRRGLHSHGPLEVYLQHRRKRMREDGYATGRPLSGRTVQLFDLEQDLKNSPIWLSARNTPDWWRSSPLSWRNKQNARRATTGVDSSNQRSARHFGVLSATEGFVVRRGLRPQAGSS